jgi:hypothetical protein
MKDSAKLSSGQKSEAPILSQVNGTMAAASCTVPGVVFSRFSIEEKIQHV